MPFKNCIHSLDAFIPFALIVRGTLMQLQMLTVIRSAIGCLLIKKRSNARPLLKMERKESKPSIFFQTAQILEYLCSVFQSDLAVWKRSY